MTIHLVEESSGDYPPKARITAIRSASVDGPDLLLRVAVAPSRRADPQDVQLRIPIDRIGSYGQDEKNPPYASGDLKLASPDLGCYEPPDFSSQESIVLPIRSLVINDHDRLKSALKGLPVGVHVVALTRDRKARAGEYSWTEHDEVKLNKESWTVLVLRGPDGATKETLLWGLDKQTKYHRALLLLTPFTVIGDIITFPVQLVAALMVGC